MYDIEKITKVIADLERYFADLDKLKVEGASMGTERFYSTSMVLFAILNRAIDLGEEVVRAKKFGMPGSYQEIFQVLGRQGIISPELSQTLQYLVKQRNVLAHEYFNITEKSIYSISLKMSAVKELMQAVRKLLQEEVQKMTPKSNGRNNGKNNKKGGNSQKVPVSKK